jgi:signal peptidase I
VPPGPAHNLDRTRRDARRFAADARRLLALGRRRKRLARGAATEIEAAIGAVEAAAKGDGAGPLSAALQALDALWAEHLAPLAGSAWRTYLITAALAAALAVAVRVGVAEGVRIASGGMAPTVLAGDRVLVTKLGYGPRVPFTGLRPWGEAPRRGDVVVLESPGAPDRALARRVVGVPGDVVELRDETLLVNGVPQPRIAAGEVAAEDREGGQEPGGSCRRYREALARGVLVPARPEEPGALGASWRAAAGAGVATHEVQHCRRLRLAAHEGPWQVVAPGHLLVLGDDRDRAADGRSPAAFQVPLEKVKGRAGLVLFSWTPAGGLAGLGRPRLERLFKVVE